MKGRPDVGTNKRYSAGVDRLMDARILQRIAADHPLQTLTDQELRKNTLPVTRDPQPKPCRAWVRFGPHAMQVDAVVVVWNDIACGVQFSVAGKEMRCWVWANAVSPGGVPGRMDDS